MFIAPPELTGLVSENGKYHLKKFKVETGCLHSEN
jgi:hypothetical protein